MKNENQLIAEFMKVRKGKHFHYDIEPFNLTEYNDVEDLKYDISWDWLIPVKDNVIPLTDDLPPNDSGPEYYDMLIDGLITGDIDQVYNSCVEVIKLTIKNKNKVMKKEYNEIPKDDHICDDGIDNLNHVDDDDLSEWTWKYRYSEKVWYPYKKIKL